MNMEPIPYFYESMNRNAILVRPKKPFYDWVNTHFKDDNLTTPLEENTIYLIREMASNEEIRKWIKRNFDKVFVNELNNWYTDETGWPKNRNYKMFCDWFEFEVHSMILDLETLPLAKE
jgi:hypothetical protein